MSVTGISIKKTRVMMNHKVALPFTMEMWRYYILPYCDLLSLIQLNWTSQQLRGILNKPEFVNEWQTQCWYLYRECMCERNLFYLQVVDFCDFAFDYNQMFRNYHEASAELRRLGRSVAMHQMDKQMNWQNTPRLVSQNNPRQFHSGIFQCWIENLIVPMPRMLPVGVEHSYLMSASGNNRKDNESEEEFHNRLFWRNFHNVDDDKIPSQQKSADWCPFDNGNYNGENIYRYEDKVDNYIYRCKAEGRDPYDPLDDMDDEGHVAAQWARKRMYGSPLGTQKYPMELCLRQCELMPNEAQRNGVDYIERMFMPLHKYHPACTLMDHHGIVYFSGIRYENERGDFVNWAVHSLALRNAFYMHMWMDCCQHLLHTLATYLRNLAQQIQDDMPPRVLRRRWLHLRHMQNCADCREFTKHHRIPFHNSDTYSQERDLEALDQVLTNGRYALYNKLIMTTVSDITPEPNNSSLFDTLLEPNDMQNYMEKLIPKHIEHNPIRTEDHMVMDLDQALELLSYMTAFAVYVGPRTGPSTEVTRLRTLQIYLASGFSLLAFAPTWKKDHYLLLKPTKLYLDKIFQDRTSSSSSTSSSELTGTPLPYNPKVPMNIPNMLLTNNHRFQRYLNFLNQRTLYYQADHAREAMEQLKAQHQVDLGKMMEM